jgi:hypothetical protein
LERAAAYIRSAADRKAAAALAAGKGRGIDICSKRAPLERARHTAHHYGEESMKIDGGCHCGAITYEAEIDPTKVTICHCTDCQTLSGSAFRTTVMTKEGTFKLLSGQLKIYVKTAESGNLRAQSFCPDCGTPISASNVGETGKIHSLRVGTIKQRNELQPTLQFWFRSAQRWLPRLATIDKLDQQPVFDAKGGAR